MLALRQARDHPQQVGVVLRPAMAGLLSADEYIAVVSLCCLDYSNGKGYYMPHMACYG